ncbi:MAG: LytTR family transcriptional regulator DNA-binding domain-containing protein [Bacteroidetes bacterium]|nr:LytTR family transcriptional regulator DNA-binding domain-containing protein [Bacteroidota bacterium]
MGRRIGISNHITKAKKYPIDYTLDQLEEIISPELFFRINRKVLININSVQKASAYFNSRLKLTIIGLCERRCNCEQRTSWILRSG